MSQRLKCAAIATSLPSFTPVRGGLVQRECACGGLAGIAGDCGECTSKRLTVQRSTQQSQPPTRNSELVTQNGGVPPVVNEVLRSPGEVLDNESRMTMEARFGHDFSRVRVHTDGAAAQSARAVNARAYTVGQQIVFAERQYSPKSEAGAHLLAHELVHTIQQGERNAGADRLTLSSPGDNLEREADSLAASHQNVPKVAGNHPPVLARMPDNPDPGTQTSSPAPGSSGPAPTTPATTPSSTGSGPVEETVPPPARKKVCLTFDDGPANGTKEVLNALGGIKATFFLTGYNLAEPDTRVSAPVQADLLASILAAGHRIANHTKSHKPMSMSAYTKLAGEPAETQKTTIQENMSANQEYFNTLFDEQKAVFAVHDITSLPAFEYARLPGSGKEFPKFIQLVKDMGLVHFGWDTEFAPTASTGLAHLTATPWQGLSSVRADRKSCPADGWIILSHDRLWANNQPVMTELIQKLQTGCNCDFGTLDSSGACS